MRQSSFREVAIELRDGCPSLPHGLVIRVPDEQDLAGIGVLKDDRDGQTIRSGCGLLHLAEAHLRSRAVLKLIHVTIFAGGRRCPSMER